MPPNRLTTTRFRKSYVNGEIVSHDNGTQDVSTTPLKSILRRSTSSAFDEVGPSDRNGDCSPLLSDDDVFRVSPPLSSASEEVASLNNNMEISLQIVNGHNDSVSHGYDSHSPSRIPVLSPKKEVQFNLDSNKNQKKKKAGIADRFKIWKN